MKKILLVMGCWSFVLCSSAQTVIQKLQKAFQQFESDSQLKHAISSLYVINAATGKVVFDKNSQVGLAGASTQKIITATTAFELLGKGYRYKTDFFYKQGLHIANDQNFGMLPSGDPTFGSWRFESTKENIIFKNLFSAFYSKILLNGDKKVSLIYWDSENETPDGWIWQDIGNYYGAAPSKLNWRENQYDIVFSSGKSGERTEVMEVIPNIPDIVINNQVLAGNPGSRDNAYIYFSNINDTIEIKGTIPPDHSRFSISGSIPDPSKVFFDQFSNYCSDIKRLFPFELKIYRNSYFGSITDRLRGIGPSVTTDIYTHYSPTLDSIIYWFLKKSINVYGEALIKTFNVNKTGLASRDTGIANLKRFWKERGIAEDELNIYDGSGLSPLNRITTHAQVEILKYAKTKDWFPYFYDALPEYNGMKMKSGTISDVKGFCGYHKSKDGKEYVFSFLVNNYNGKTSGVVNKMYKVLDELK